MDNSIGAYEQLYDNNATSENLDKYCDGWLELKGRFNRWTRYWCELIKKNLHFFKDVNTQIKDNYAGFFSIEGTTKIESHKKFEWHIVKGSRKIILRAQNQQNHDDWINALTLSMSGGSPSKKGYILPGSGPVSPPSSPQHQLSFHQSPPSSPGPAPFSSQRRVSTDSIRYALQPDQMQHLVDHAESIAENVSMSIDEMKIQERLLEGDQSWYQATFRREDVQEILSNEENGVFIVRDYIDVSTSKNMGFVISLKDHKGDLRHHKILKSNDGSRIFIKGYEEKFFDSLTNLLRFFVASQKKTVALIPFNKNRPSKVDRGQYLNMAPPVPTQHNGVSTRPARSVSMRETPDMPPKDLMPTKARSHSLYENRGLPPVPPAPLAGMVRAEPMRNRELPSTLGDSRNDTAKRYGDEYMRMAAPTATFRNRQLPTPPPANDDTYLSPFDHDTQGSRHAEDDELGPYETMSSPQKQRYNPSPNCRKDTPSSPPMFPDDQSCYINMSPPPPPPSLSSSSYENYEPEQAPKLPPKRSQSMKDCQYVNFPAGGGTKRPDRPPLRKAHTLGR